ncbi:hypothetical protein [Aureispira anguillae]|nr:hypothetical protein [Aureispira anguillae]
MNLKDKVQQIDELNYPSYQDLMQKSNAKKSFTRFNEEGLIINSAIYNNNNTMLWMKYLYQGDSIWINETIEVANKVEHPQAYWLYQLDKNGAQKSITSILIDSSVNFHIDLEVNSDGNATNIAYSQQKHPAHVPCQITKTYDAQGQIKEELSYHYDDIRKRCREQATQSLFKVNEQGDIIREIITTYDGRKRNHSYTYTYDKKGNWTQRLHYLGDDVQEVIIREFTYYD